MSHDEDKQNSKTTEVPVARLKTRSTANHSKLWWLTAVCLVLVVGLFGSRYFSQGPIIEIQFQDGYGLKVGDTLRYRGVDIGEVVDVKLSGELESVTAFVQLDPHSQNVAVEGSQFWIQRARLRIGQISGLDTVLGAKYLGVVPGDAEGNRQNQFIGVETPLGMTEGGWVSVNIRFSEGSGIQVGDPVRYRGIDVGEVVRVDLDATMESVELEVHLIGQAMKFARTGSQFWIERPRLDLTEVRGLDTLVAGRYVAVEFSDSEENQPQTEFVGLDLPPQRSWQAGSLEVELECPNRNGITAGAPVMYRGLEVGEVTHVRLADDAASLLITCVVQPESASLVRDDSKWWIDSGMQFDAGLSGFNLEVPSLSALLRGGVSFATPTSPGEPAATGKRFQLHEKAEANWLQWQPRLQLGEPGSKNNIGADVSNVKPIQVSAKWQSGMTGFYRQKSVQAWAMVTRDHNGNELLLVTETFWKKVEAGGDDVAIEFAGQRLKRSEMNVEAYDKLVALKFPEGFDASALTIYSFPNRVAKNNDLLQVTNSKMTTPLAIDKSRLTSTEAGSLLDPSISVDSSWEGSAVTNRAGVWVGVLSQVDGKWYVLGADLQDHLE